MDILLSDVKVRLIEDRPSVNITSPGPVPIELKIGKMHINRNESGVFEIQPPEMNPSKQNESIIMKTDRNRELKSLQLVMQQLKLDNDSLKKKLISSEKMSEANLYVSTVWNQATFVYQLFDIISFCRGKIRQESDMLKSYLRQAQDDISILLSEKQNLLDTVRQLQVFIGLILRHNCIVFSTIILVWSHFRIRWCSPKPISRTMMATGSIIAWIVFNVVSKIIMHNKFEYFFFFLLQTENKKRSFKHWLLWSICDTNKNSNKFL